MLIAIIFLALGGVAQMWELQMVQNLLPPSLGETLWMPGMRTSLHTNLYTVYMYTSSV